MVNKDEYNCASLPRWAAREMLRKAAMSLDTAVGRRRDEHAVMTRQDYSRLP